MANAAKGASTAAWIFFPKIFETSAKSPNGYTKPVHTTLTAFSAIPIEQWVSNVTTEAKL